MIFRLQPISQRFLEELGKIDFQIMKQTDKLYMMFRRVMHLWRKKFESVNSVDQTTYKVIIEKINQSVVDQNMPLELHYTLNPIVVDLLESDGFRVMETHHNTEARHDDCQCCGCCEYDQTNIFWGTSFPNNSFLDIKNLGIGD